MFKSGLYLMNATSSNVKNLAEKAEKGYSIFNNIISDQDISIFIS